mgnify:FL=1
MNNEQKAFEQWYLAENPLNTVDKTPSGLKNNDVYCKPATRRAWAAWKAGAAYHSAVKYPVELAIVTIDVRPPIPHRGWDYCAYYKGEEENGHYGWGETVDAAIKDLIQRYGDE